MISDLDAVIIMAPVLAGGLAAGWGLRSQVGRHPDQELRDAYDDGYADAMDRRDEIAAQRQPPPPTPAEREYQETWGNLARLRADADTWFREWFGDTP